MAAASLAVACVAAVSAGERWEWQVSSFTLFAVVVAAAAAAVVCSSGGGGGGCCGLRLLEISPGLLILTFHALYLSSNCNGRSFKGVFMAAFIAAMSWASNFLVSGSEPFSLQFLRIYATVQYRPAQWVPLLGITGFLDQLL
jgi:hypothetical protein